MLHPFAKHCADLSDQGIVAARSAMLDGTYNTISQAHRCPISLFACPAMLKPSLDQPDVRKENNTP